MSKASKEIASEILVAAMQKQEIDKLFLHGLHASEDAHIHVIKRLADAYKTLYEAVDSCGKDDKG
jgi:hypothetical protein